MLRRLFHRPEKPFVPKVWITLNGFPFYVPVTAPEVELCYGIEAAANLRRRLGFPPWSV